MIFLDVSDADGFDEDVMTRALKKRPILSPEEFCVSCNLVRLSSYREEEVNEGSRRHSLSAAMAVL